MKRVFSLATLLACATLCGSAGAITLGTFAVNAQNSFLYQSSNDVNVGALIIDLTCPIGVTTNCVNAPAGTSLTLIGLGLTCYTQIGCPPESAPTLGGVFDSNNVLLPSGSLPPGNVNRLTGTINAGAPTNLVFHNPFLNTYYGNVDTTIPNDFYIPTGAGLTVVVPSGANFLVIGLLDSFMGDNSDPSHTLALQINGIGPPAPEPGTIGLMLAGIALIAFRQWRVGRAPIA
jgi:hypothetical protein